MNNKLFSILIFILEEEKMITCLKNIYKQDFYNCEIILVCDYQIKLSRILNDLSSQYKMQIIFSKDPDIKKIRNKALKLCKGKYILFMRENEFYSKDYLHECCKKALISKNKLIIANAEDQDPLDTVFGKIYERDLIKESGIEFQDGDHDELNFNQQYLKCSSGIVMCKKAICKKNF